MTVLNRLSWQRLHNTSHLEKCNYGTHAFEVPSSQLGASLYKGRSANSGGLGNSHPTPSPGQAKVTGPRGSQGNLTSGCTCGCFWVRLAFDSVEVQSVEGLKGTDGRHLSPAFLSHCWG
jgi:hypothetical protein